MRRRGQQKDPVLETDVKMNYEYKTTYPKYIFVVVILYFQIMFLYYDSGSVSVSNIPYLKHKNLRVSDEYDTGEAYSRRNIARGIILCASEFMIGDVINLINQTHFLWKSKLHYTLFHCSELSETSAFRIKKLSLNLFHDIHHIAIHDMCVSDHSHLNCTKSRLRGFFCKPAALLLSPYTETILMDVDTIWFDNPDVLFDAPAYLQSGTMFFRDRFLYHKPGQILSGLNYSEVVQYIAQESRSQVKISPSTARALEDSGGYSLFWRYAMETNISVKDSLTSNELGPLPLQHVQDSSVVVLNRHQHKETLEVLRRILPTFALGYGDKEIYWIAATIARQTFSFEPYLFAIYGDCGALMHYDPRHPPMWLRYLLPYHPSPLYLNAEYLLQCLNVIGEFNENVMSKPVPVSRDMRLFSMGPSNPTTLGLCGACTQMGCMAVPEKVRRAIRLAQEAELGRIDREYQTKECLKRRQKASSLTKLFVIKEDVSETPPLLLEGVLNRMRISLDVKVD